MMAGLNVGTSNWGKFRGSPETVIPKPQPAPETGGINTAPSQPPPMSMPPPRPPMSMGGGINVGRGSQMGILPSSMPGDAFRQYATVNGGQITPPANPYGPPSNLPTGGGAGTWGPVNTGPSNPLQYMQGGGFTGGRMPPPVAPGFNPFTAPTPDQQTMGSGSSAAMAGYGGPPPQIPNMRGDSRFMNRNALRNAYGRSPRNQM